MLEANPKSATTPAMTVMLEHKTSANAVDRVVEFIRGGIESRRYAPGYRLVESDLTAELGVSRGPVREALRRLAAERLVELIPNRGALVRRLALREALELLQIRIAVETLAVELACERAKQESVRVQFQKDIEGIWRDAPRTDASAYLEENNRFHQAIARASGNEQLIHLSRQLQFPLILYQTRAALTSKDIERSIQHHRQIARAIMTGDGESASGIIKKHISAVADQLNSVPKDMFRSESAV